MMIITATSDAGPAHYLSAVIKNINKNCHCLSSNISSRVFDDYKIKNRIIDVKNQNKLGDYIHNAFPDKDLRMIITGTSWGNCIDKALIKFGIENNIKVISIVEHWSWYRERFTLDNKLILPDYIIVNDEIAKKEAIEDGLPGEILYPLGNPVLEQMAQKKLKTLPKKKWLKKLSLPDRKIVTFISEDYRKNFNEKSDFHQGFDEFQAIEDIVFALKDTHHLLIKVHPSEKINKYDKFKNRKDITIIQKTDIDSLILNSDFIIGMGSMFLLEAAMHRNDIISYRPGDKKGFIGNKIGATFSAKNKYELKNVLTGKQKIQNPGFINSYNHSTEKIINFIEDKLN